MKNLVLALLLGLGMVQGVVWADAGEALVVSATTSSAGRQTTTVFNDSGGALTSGAIVVWDNDDTEFDRSGYPYVTTVSQNGHEYVAGVILNGSCPDQTLCEIVTHGWARVNIAHSTAAAIEDDKVSTSTVAGQAGDWDAGAQECYLGTVLELYNLATSATAASADLIPMPVFVNIGCDDT